MFGFLATHGGSCQVKYPPRVFDGPLKQKGSCSGHFIFSLLALLPAQFKQSCYRSRSGQHLRSGLTFLSPREVAS